MCLNRSMIILICSLFVKCPAQREQQNARASFGLKRGRRFLWAGQVSNLCRLAPTILQTASFNHSDTDPCGFVANAARPGTGFEPATRCLQNSRSGQLSYPGSCISETPDYVTVSRAAMSRVTETKFVHSRQKPERKKCLRPHGSRGIMTPTPGKVPAAFPFRPIGSLPASVSLRFLRCCRRVRDLR